MNLALEEILLRAARHRAVGGRVTVPYYDGYSTQYRARQCETWHGTLREGLARYGVRWTEAYSNTTRSTVHCTEVGHSSVPTVLCSTVHKTAAGYRRWPVSLSIPVTEKMPPIAAYWPGAATTKFMKFQDPNKNLNFSVQSSDQEGNFIEHSTEHACSGLVSDTFSPMMAVSWCLIVIFPKYGLFDRGFSWLTG